MCRRSALTWLPGASIAGIVDIERGYFLVSMILRMRRIFDPGESGVLKGEFCSSMESFDTWRHRGIGVIWSWYLA